MQIFMKIAFYPWIIVLLFGVTFTSCDMIPKKKAPKTNKESDWFVTKSGDSLLRRFRKDGTLQSYSTCVNQIKHGLAKSFHENGKTQFEIYYRGGLKHGPVKWYYEEGTLYRESTYVNGEIDGIQKKYYKNEKLMAEIPYEKGRIMPGLKEYMKSGKLKKKHPRLIIEPIDRMAFENKYALRLSLSNNAKKVKYFQVMKFNNSNRTHLKELDSENGIGEIIYFVSKGGFVMEQVHIRAEFKTSLGNTYVLEKKYNVAVDN